MAPLFPPPRSHPPGTILTTKVMQDMVDDSVKRHTGRRLGLVWDYQLDNEVFCCVHHRVPKELNLTQIALLTTAYKDSVKHIVVNEVASTLYLEVAVQFDECVHICKIREDYLSQVGAGLGSSITNLMEMRDGINNRIYDLIVHHLKGEREP